MKKKPKYCTSLQADQEKNLRVGKGYFRSWHSRRLESGRAYHYLKQSSYQKQKGLNSAWVELGLDRDLENESFANERSQNFLRTCITDWPIKVKLRSERELGWSLSIAPDVKEPFTLGHFSKFSKDEISKLAGKLIYGKWLKPLLYKMKNREYPIDDGVFIIGAKTVAIGRNPTPLVKPPYRDSGIWLAPIIRGFPSLLFAQNYKTSKWKKRKWN